MRDYVALIGPGNPFQVSVSGNSFHIVSAASEVKVSINNNSAQFTRTQGDTVAGISYGDVILSSEISQSVTVCLGYGISTSSNALTTGDIDADVARASGIVALPHITIPAGANAQIAAPNLNRRELRVGVSSDQPNGVTIGGSNAVNAASGGYLEIGAADYLTLTGEVWAFNAGTSPVTVNVSESLV